MAISAKAALFIFSLFLASITFSLSYDPQQQQAELLEWLSRECWRSCDERHPWRPGMRLDEETLRPVTQCREECDQLHGCRQRCQQTAQQSGGDMQQQKHCRSRCQQQLHNPENKYEECQQICLTIDGKQGDLQQQLECVHQCARQLSKPERLQICKQRCQKILRPSGEGDGWDQDRVEQECETMCDHGEQSHMYAELRQCARKCEEWYFQDRTRLHQCYKEQCRQRLTCQKHCRQSSDQKECDLRCLHLVQDPELKLEECQDRCIFYEQHGDDDQCFDQCGKQLSEQEREQICNKRCERAEYFGDWKAQLRQCLTRCEQGEQTEGQRQPE